MARVPEAPQPDDYAISDAELQEMDSLTKSFREDDWHEFENKLYLYAMVRGWTGDPMKQPPRIVLSIARQVAKGEVPGAFDVEEEG